MSIRARKAIYAVTALVWVALALLVADSFINADAAGRLTDTAEQVLYLLAAVTAISSVLVAMLAPIAAANQVWLQILSRPECHCRRDDVRSR